MRTSFAMISTYPPTQCGIATFSQSLLGSLRASGADVNVVRVMSQDDRSVLGAGDDSDVVHEWTRPSGAIAAARSANDHDVAVIQHEYGIFPGEDGIDVLGLADSLEVPLVTVLHTVVENPSSRQRLILERLSERSHVVVTMTRAARSRLLHRYDVDPRVVRVIPHGAVDNRVRIAVRDPRPTILTWGLLGPGKGIEHAVRAMALLADLDPRPLYRVVGQTHPRVLERDGTAYQDMLAELVADLGLTGRVVMDHHYADAERLRSLVQRADAVVLPYDSVDQVTSGVLIEAVASATPVVATRFPHADELLATGAGITVPHRDPGAIADALRRVFTEPGLARRMSTEASRLAPDLLWSSVADRYREIADSALDSMVRSAS